VAPSDNFTAVISFFLGGRAECNFVDFLVPCRHVPRADGKLQRELTRINRTINAADIATANPDLFIVSPPDSYKFLFHSTANHSEPSRSHRSNQFESTPVAGLS